MNWRDANAGIQGIRVNATFLAVSVIKGTPMSVTEAAEAVQRVGYRSNSRTFRTQVNIALIKGPFKRVGRGEYTAK